MVQGCVICFNDTPALIERCLKSIRDKVDTVLVVDGAFATYPHESPKSTDGTLEKAKEYADEVIERDDAWRSQMDKRNAYLTLKSVKDYYLWLDTDEYFEGDLPPLKEDFYAIPVITDGITEYQVRCFRQQKGLRYKKKHSWLWLDGNIVSQDACNDNIVKLDTCRIIHTPNARTEEKIADDTAYIKERDDNNTEGDVISQIVKIEPLEKGAVIKNEKLIALEVYSGFDLDSKPITVRINEEFNCSYKKMQQLLTDFPKQFRRI